MVKSQKMAVVSCFWLAWDAIIAIIVLHNKQQMGRSKMKQLAKLKSLLSFKNQSFVAGVVVSLVVLFVGYGLIKNIKTDKQSASAEQVSGSPESGVKSRISELYDTLKAKNLGSDTDMTGLDALTDDWGAKWNRIKSAALKSQPGGGAGGAVPVAGAVKSVQRGVTKTDSQYHTKTINISTINPLKTVVMLNGPCYQKNKYSYGGTRYGSVEPRIDSVTSSTVSFKCDFVSSGEEDLGIVTDFSYQVIEYY